MSDETVVDAPAKPRPKWPGITIAVIFGILYAYVLWEAISPLVELPRIYVQIGYKAADIPWWILIAGVLLPVLVYAAAFVMGRRSRLWVRALLFFVGLTLLECLKLGLIALEIVHRQGIIPS